MYRLAMLPLSYKCTVLLCCHSLTNVPSCYAATLLQMPQLLTLSFQFLSISQYPLLSNPTFITNPKCHPSINIKCSNTFPFIFSPHVTRPHNSFNSCHNQVSPFGGRHQLLQPPTSDRGSLLAWCILSTNLNL